MNVNRCDGFRNQYGRYCAFLDLPKGKDGKPDWSLAKCTLRGFPHDYYNLYPEHDTSTGRLVYNRSDWGTPKPWRVGTTTLWESLTFNDTGWFYTYQDRRIPADKDMHPGYALYEINEPTAESIAENTIITPFGEGESLCFSTVGWAEQRTRGIEARDVCRPGIYGHYDETEGIVIPKCARDYCSEIPGWVNYTNIPSTRTKNYTFFLAKASDGAVLKHCLKWFGHTKSALAIAEIMLAIKSGEYIPMWDVLQNHGIHQKTVSMFMRETCVRLHNVHSPMNMYKYFAYYRRLCQYPPAKSIPLRANLLNFVLNDPRLAKLNPRKPDQVFTSGGLGFATASRYWWLVMLIKAAITDGLRTKKHILNYGKLPEWLGPMMEEYGKKRRPPDERTGKNPPVIKFEDLVYDSDVDENSVLADFRKDKNPSLFKRRARIFTGIAKAGLRWTKPQVRAAWFNFCRAQQARKPVIFWEWVESMRLANGKQTRDLLVDPVEIAPERAFAVHLKAHRKSRDSFEMATPDTYAGWKTIPRTSSLVREDEGQRNTDPRDVFWKELNKVHVKSGQAARRMFNKFVEDFARMDPEKAKLIMSDFTGETVEDITMGNVVDGEDIGQHGGQGLKVVNIDGATEKIGKGRTEEDAEYSPDDDEFGGMRDIEVDDFQEKIEEEINDIDDKEE